MSGTRDKSMPAKPAPDLPVEDDERYSGEVDGFITRNRDALNDSVRRSRKEVAEGKVSAKTIPEIVAEGRARHTNKK